MRTVVLLFAALSLFACGGSDEPAAKPLSEAGEKLYDMRGVIQGRDAADNTLRVDHEAIPGFMEAMTMDYSVRGAKVESLPKDGSRVSAKLHTTERSYWLTDVKPIAR
ncbi:MAG TPA: copper-binding protein [Thermoanaerobaculia bacterium]|nr:copper-binding protein [Thermoanaerobaculia bacterium]